MSQNESQHLLEIKHGNPHHKHLKKQTPIPKLEVLCLSIMLLCEGYNSTFLYSFLGYMIVDFGLVDNENKAGYYAGFIASSYSITQLFSGIMFGVAGDAKFVSKRTILLIGTAGTCLFTLMFGLSTNFYFAVMMRMLTGMLNGNISTTKSYMADITDETNQNQAFSIIGIAWCAGCVFGPAFGGLLARPAQKYPSVFGGWVFTKFPYLLPCLFCCLLMTIGGVIALFCLRTNIESSEVEASVQSDPEAQSTSWKLRVTQLLKHFIYFEAFIVMLNFTIASMFEISQNELFPLWSMLSEAQGGLMFNTTKTGFYQGMTGIWMILVQGLIYPKVATKLGKLKALRIGYLMVLPLAFTPQLSYLLHFDKWVLWAFLSFYSLFRATSSVFYFSSLVILVNNSAPYGKSGLYASVSQSCICLSKTVTPIMVGSIFASSTKLRHPLRLNISFFTCSGLVLLSTLSTFLLSPKLNSPKLKPKSLSVTTVSTA